jgi:hypothetical protein
VTSDVSSIRRVNGSLGRTAGVHRPSLKDAAPT